MNNKKTYVLDTNILLHNPHALLSFDDNDVILPDVVIDELDHHKSDKGEIGANARAAARMLDKFREDTENGTLLEGYILPTTGVLRVEMNCVDTKMPETWKDTPDLRILRVCKGLKDKGKNIILVSNDSYVRIKADILGVKSEIFTTERAPMPEDLYQGRREAYATSVNINKFFSEKKLPEKSLIYLDENGDEIEMEPLKLHEYVSVKSIDGTSQSFIGIFDGDNIVPLRNNDSRPYDLKAKNVGQKFIIDALERSAQEAPLVIVKGPAGTGKTLVALAVGLEAVQERGQYRKILYLRGNTKLDEDIGYLPGTEGEKLEWALRPVRDNLEVLLSHGKDKDEDDMSMGKKTKKGKRRYDSEYEYDYDDKSFLTSENQLKDMCDEIFERGYINIEAVAHMRGRSVANTFVIIDEAQNLTPKQIRTLLSRCSKDTKIVLLGDPYQIDHPYLDFRTNGLCYAADRMAGSPTTFQISLIEEECERSELSLEISKRMSDK